MVIICFGFCCKIKFQSRYYRVRKRIVYLDSKQILNLNFTHKLPRSLDKAGLYSLKLCSWSDITWERPPWLVVSEEDDSLYFVKYYWRVFFRSAMTYCTTSGGPTCPSAQKSGSLVYRHVPYKSSEDSSNQPDGPIRSPRHPYCPHRTPRVPLSNPWTFPLTLLYP